MKFDDDLYINQKTVKIYGDIKIENDELPRDLISLYLENNFNKKIVTNTKGFKNIKSFELNNKVLPNTLKFLKFGDFFNKTFCENEIPSSLEILIFGYAFEDKIDIDKMPIKLKQITYNSECKKRQGIYEHSVSFDYKIKKICVGKITFRCKKCDKLTLYINNRKITKHQTIIYTTHGITQNYPFILKHYTGEQNIDEHYTEIGFNLQYECIFSSKKLNIKKLLKKIFINNL